MRDDSIRRSPFPSHWKRVLRRYNREADIHNGRANEALREAVQRDFKDISKNFYKQLRNALCNPQGGLFENAYNFSPDRLGANGTIAERLLSENVHAQARLGNRNDAGFENAVRATLSSLKDAQALAITAHFRGEGVSPNDKCLKAMRSDIQQIDMSAETKSLMAGNHTRPKIKTALDFDANIGLTP